MFFRRILEIPFIFTNSISNLCAFPNYAQYTNPCACTYYSTLPGARTYPNSRKNVSAYYVPEGSKLICKQNKNENYNTLYW